MKKQRKEEVGRAVSTERELLLVFNQLCCPVMHSLIVTLSATP